MDNTTIESLCEDISVNHDPTGLALKDDLQNFGSLEPHVYAWMMAALFTIFACGLSFALMVNGKKKKILFFYFSLRSL